MPHEELMNNPVEISCNNELFVNHVIHSSMKDLKLEKHGVVLLERTTFTVCVSQEDVIGKI